MVLMKEERFLFRTAEYLFLVLIASSHTHCSVSSFELLTPTAKDKTTEVFNCSQNTEVSISTDYIYYRITGSKVSKLRTQMDQLGRKDEFGHHWDAYTEWYVTWS